MSSKLCKQNHDDIKLPNLGKEILEVKKRIQLSEGQRKALFEEIENDSKRDGDEILRLKKEIATLTIALHEQRTNVLSGLIPSIPPATTSANPCRKLAQQTSAARSGSSGPGRSNKVVDEATFTITTLRSIIGNSNVGSKSLQQIVDQLDLQRIDKCKQLDLLNYKYKLKELKLKKLAEVYQKQLLFEQIGDDMEEARAKNEIVAKEFRNRINAVQVQIKEAEHVRTRYKDIRWKLQEDAAKFESKMVQLDEDLKQQNIEIDKIKQVNQEALKLRTEARNSLQKEEKQVIAANASRDKQSTEGKRLVEARMEDLEKLERHIYHPKSPTHRDNEDAPDIYPEVDEDPSLDPMQELKQNIELLKEATGSSCIEEVLAKVKGQTTTQVRLMTLRKTKENIKLAKQKQFDAMSNELETMKFAEDKDTQQNTEEVENVKAAIKESKEKTQETKKEIEKIHNLMMKIVAKLMNTYLGLCHGEDSANVNAKRPLELVKKINEIIKTLKGEGLKVDNEGATVEELLEELNERESGNWLPEPYNDIVRRTPVPTSRAPTPVPPPSATGGSEDEEELPTRGYLKRQAQMVVDAKNKRKTMRFPIPKTK